MWIVARRTTRTTSFRFTADLENTSVLMSVAAVSKARKQRFIYPQQALNAHALVLLLLFETTGKRRLHGVVAVNFYLQATE
jgi:hypothetical protein